jgi:VanZ family protein
MVFIFYLSSLHTTGIPGTQTERFIILKSFHLIEYGILAISLYIGFKKFRHTIFTAYLYALSDELHQSFIPGREARFRDTLIDLLGIFIGIILIKTLIRFKILKNSY